MNPAGAQVRVAAARSNAFRTASQQIETTYKAQIDQQQSRGQTLQAEVNVLIAKYNEETRKTPRNETAVAAAGKAVQDKQRAAETPDHPGCQWLHAVGVQFLAGRACGASGFAQGLRRQSAGVH